MKTNGLNKLQAAIATATGCLLLLLPQKTFAEPTDPGLVKDINVNGLAFGVSDAFSNGSWGLDDTASFKGNDILVQTQVAGACCNGAGISIPISNGENGYTETFDDTEGFPRSNDVSNPDIDNATPPDSVFATIGNVIPPANDFPPFPVTGEPNPRLGLNNGNILRYSMWVREDPNNPITNAPEIEPVLKFEFYKEALSIDPVDNNGGAQTFFGDKIYDTDQQEGDGVWIDIDNSGSAADGSATIGNGRLKTISSEEWTLIEVVHEVDDFDWFGIADDIYTVADVEEIRAVMFWGDFNGDNGEAGSLWFDNVQVEIFKDAASVTPNMNPNPILDEVNEDADFDNDGDTDGTDYLTWQSSFGGDGSTGGDADFSGLVDGVDLTIWQNLYDGNAALSASSVPEPSSVAVLLLGLACLGGARRAR